MGARAKVRIAGAGALGLSCAVALADVGLEVEVYDPGRPAEGASGVAAGMLAPVFEAALDEVAHPHLALLLAARNRWPAFAQRTGVRLDRAGAMAVGAEPWLDSLARRLDALGQHAAEFPIATARTLAPGLSPDFPRALFTREDWRLDAQAALAALRAAARQAGVGFRPEALRERGDADLLVVASGASRDLVNLAPELSSLTPIKGHILRLQAPPPAVVVRGQGVYLAPGDAALAVGATMEAGVSDPDVDPAHAEPLRAAAARLFPGLRDAPAELQAGVRAATPDGLPLVGPSQGPGVLLAVGARRNGWLLAPLAAEIVAAYATGGDLSPLAASLAPARLQRRGA